MRFIILIIFGVLEIVFVPITCNIFFEFIMSVFPYTVLGDVIDEINLPFKVFVGIVGFVVIATALYWKRK